MKVLISNDDGIDSKGLKLLAERLALDNEVLVVAPDGNRTAYSHSLTIGKPLRLEEVNTYSNCLAYSLSGTPADCIKFAKLHFNDFLPDVVIAGINKGHNLGSDVLYSGTVSIACEASFFGNISFAFSAFSLEDSNFSLYADYAVKIINTLLPYSHSGDVWNINFPDDTYQPIKGVKITTLGKQLYSDRYEKVGQDLYKLVGELIDNKENPKDCDIEWIKKGYITVTPILIDKTDREKIGKIKDKCEKLL